MKGYLTTKYLPSIWDCTKVRDKHEAPRAPAKITPRFASAILDTVAAAPVYQYSDGETVVTLGDIRGALEQVLDERSMLREAIKKALGVFGPMEEDDEPHPSIADTMERLRAVLDLTKGDD